MRILDEAAVRQLYIKKRAKRICLGEYDFVTPQARAYIREKKITCDEDSPAVHADIHPYVDPQPQESIADTTRPVYMTHLYGTRLVVKNHPRIVLRGKLDSLQAEIVLCQIRLDIPELSAKLDNLMAFVHAILTAEVTGNPFSCDVVLGRSTEEIHEMSHHPQKAIGVDHVFPSKEMGEAAACMNVLRAKSRETELAAVDAFYRDGEAERTDLIQALNRLSSAFYVLECQCAAGNFAK